jgi:LAO/AO transport system kinase
MQEKEIRELLEGSRNLEKFSIARAISLLEREDSRSLRNIIFPMLHSMGLSEKRGFTVGITGTPGAGKSSLIGELTRIFLEKNPNHSMAVVAIDPSSNISGGSILGDRTRVVMPRRENRIFFRSQASQLELGGVNPHTYHVIRLLRHFFDYVLVETVGIGQNEVEVSLLSDYAFLVLQPLGGDQVQFMKSGIMEVPDAFIINKMDEESLGESSYHMLINTLEFLRDVLPSQKLPPVFKTSVTKKRGIDELWEFISNQKFQKNRNKESLYQLEKWIRNEYGRFGIRIFREHDQRLLEHFESYEVAEIDFLSRLSQYSLA